MKTLHTLLRLTAAAFTAGILLVSTAACDLNRIPQGDCTIDRDYVIDCRPDPGLSQK